jgi:DNA-binding GntR family transcriptional regulator
MPKNDSLKLASELADKISAKIMSGLYPPGSKLRQEALAEEFAVSRTPIREALNQLEAKGLVSQRQGFGATVCAPTSREIRENYQVRSEVEGLAAELAAKWITDPQLDQLAAIHQRFCKAVQDLNQHAAERTGAEHLDEAGARAQRDWVQSNSEFHSLIYEASNNMCLVRIISELHLGYTHNFLNTSALGMYKYRMEQNIVHHQAILDALVKRDPKGAREAMSRHILEAGDFVIAWFETRGRQAGSLQA